jgi:catechol 2,3-dioxygenase-like lactoylglutathione lyase family enzyme
MTTTTAGTVSKVANVIIPVRDQDAQIDFYTDVLGLEKRTDIPMGDEHDGRWVEVAPSGADTVIAICPPGPKNEAGGKDTGITLQTDDIDGYHELLADRGVDVDDEVSRMGEPVPPLFWLRDPEGNQLMIVEVK